MNRKELKMANSDYAINEMCDVFELNQSTYFVHIKQKSLVGEKKKIISILKKTAIETKYTYGKRRMQQQLKLEGINIGIHKTASMMKQAKIVAIRPKKKNYYPNGGICNIKIENVLDRQFKQKNQTHIGLVTSLIFATTKAGVIWQAYWI